MDRDQAGYALPFGVDTPYQMPGTFRRRHKHIHVLRRHDLAEVDIEAVRKREGIPRAKVVLDALRVQRRLELVIHENHRDISLMNRFIYGQYLHAVALRGIP